MKKLLVFSFIFLNLNVYSQTETFTLFGKVLDQDEEPVIAATILVQGDNTGVFTNENGRFEIKVNINDVIEISHVGFETQTLNINSEEDINVILEEIVCSCGPSPFSVKKKRRKNTIIISTLALVPAVAWTLLKNKDVDSLEK